MRLPRADRLALWGLAAVLIGGGIFAGGYSLGASRAEDRVLATAYIAGYKDGQEEVQGRVTGAAEELGIMADEDYTETMNRHIALTMERDDLTRDYRRELEGYRLAADDVEREYGLTPPGDDAGEEELRRYVEELEELRRQEAGKLLRHNAAEDLIEAAERDAVEVKRVEVTD